MKKIAILIIAVIMMISNNLLAQDNYVPTPENLKNRQEFQDDKFGIFIHWGIYSMLATGEWTMTNNNIDHKEYEKLASAFYPILFDADSWVKNIKESGARYICFTTRHHDSFSMFDTKESDYNIVKATPFKRDVLKELSNACEKHGIKLHLYYSHLDWHREDYPWGRTGRGTGRKNPEGNWKSYYTFMNNQLKELLTNYGNIRVIWFDGHWDQDQKKDFNWELPEQYKMIHSIQPACLIGNNHHITPYKGEDIQIFERDLPGENKAGLSGQDISALPLETCETMNGMWGYKITDQNYKSPKTLIHYLVRAAGKNANLLMNIGPQPNGELPKVAIERLKEIGKWMKVYGETIYGTRGGIIKPQEWGVSTQKGNKLYIHVLESKDSQLLIDISPKKIKSIVKFTDKSKVDYKKNKDSVLIDLKEAPNDIDLVLEVTLK